MSHIISIRKRNGIASPRGASKILYYNLRSTSSGNSPTANVIILCSSLFNLFIDWIGSVSQVLHWYGGLSTSYFVTDNSYYPALYLPSPSTYYSIMSKLLNIIPRDYNTKARKSSSWNLKQIRFELKKKTELSLLVNLNMHYYAQSMLGNI